MAWAAAQRNKSNTSTTIASLAFTTQNNAQNSLITCAVWYFCPTAQSGDLTISDSKSNSWSKASSEWFSPASGVYAYIGLFYAVNTNGTGGEKLTVSITGYKTGAEYTNVWLEEYTGNATAGVLDVAGAAHPGYTSPDASSQTINAAPLTTTVDGDLITSLCIDTWGYAGALNVGPGFTSLKSTAGLGTEEYEVQTSHGGITPTFVIPTASGAGSPICMTVSGAFKVASGAATVAIVKVALAVSAKATHVNEAVAVTKKALALTARPLHINEAAAITKAALSCAGKALHVNEAYVVIKAVLSLTGKSLTAASGTVLQITRAALGFAGRAIHINEACVVVKAALSIAGKPFTASGAQIVAVTKAILTFSTGQIVGMGARVRRLWINLYSTWTGNPKSGGF